MKTFDEDAATVRNLLHDHLPSALLAPPDTSPLTMGEVFCRMHADRRIPSDHLETVLTLLQSRALVPASLKIHELEALVAPIVLSHAFWRTFRDTAIPMGLALSWAQAQLSRDTRLAGISRASGASPRPPRRASRRP